MVSRIKLLFVGINYRYINPTSSHLPAALSMLCEVHYYGPGFTNDEVLDRGIDNYVDSIGNVDAIVVTKDFAGDYDAERLNRFIHQSVVIANKYKVTPKTLLNVREFLRRNRTRVIVSLLDVDIFALQNNHLDTFLLHGRYFISLGSGVLDLSAPELENEPYVREKRKRGLELGLYEGFSKNQKENIISSGFFVSESEFSWGGLAVRPNDVFVPGSRYFRRASISLHLRKTKNLVVARDFNRIAFQVARHLKLRPHARYYLAHIYNLAYQRLMTQSKICVTDGGLINFTIRKYFEIPAAGALLICWPTIDFKSLGFKHGVNCISVENEADVVQSIRAVADEPESFQAIASAGQELILRQHSVTARGIQFNKAMHRILAGDFRGSTWENGNFVLTPRDHESTTRHESAAV